MIHLHYRILLLFLFVFGSRTQAQDERAAWFAERWKIIEEAKAGGNKELIPQLGLIVGSIGDNKKRDPDVEVLYQAAKETLLAIPGHAEFYAKEIRNITEKEIKGFRAGHSSQRAWHYQTLSRLQSPETVKVLGELVFDERDPWDTDGWGDGGRPYANAFHAVRALHELGIRNPPVIRSHPDYRGDVRTWQLWFEQVRAGNRTFSFEGDDTIYSLAGPVSEAREPAAPLGERSRNPAAGPPADTGSGRKLWPVVAASALALLALFMALRKSKRLPAS